MSENLLQQGIAALKAGQKSKARILLEQVLQKDERNEMAWLWLSGAVETDNERRVCLQKVSAINPNNRAAQLGLHRIGLRMPNLDQTRQPLSNTSTQSPSFTGVREVRTEMLFDDESGLQDKIYELQIEIKKLEANIPTRVNPTTMAFSLFGLVAAIASFFVFWYDALCGGGLFLLGVFCWQIIRALDGRDAEKRKVLEGTIDLAKKRLAELESRLKTLKQ